VTDKQAAKFAANATAVIEWLIDATAPPMPPHVERHIVEMHHAILKMDGDAREDGDEAELVEPHTLTVDQLPGLQTRAEAVLLAGCSECDSFVEPAWNNCAWCGHQLKEDEELLAVGKPSIPID